MLLRVVFAKVSLLHRELNVLMPEVTELLGKSTAVNHEYIQLLTKQQQLKNLQKNLKYR